MDEDMLNMLAEVQREEAALAGAVPEKRPVVSRFTNEDDDAVTVSNLPLDAEINDIAEFFAVCGKINKLTKNINSQTGAFEGFVYIYFSNREGSQRAVTQKNGASFGTSGNILTVTAKKRDAVAVPSKVDVEVSDKPAEE